MCAYSRARTHTLVCVIPTPPVCSRAGCGTARRATNTPHLPTRRVCTVCWDGVRRRIRWQIFRPSHGPHFFARPHLAVRSAAICIVIRLAPSSSHFPFHSVSMSQTMCMWHLVQPFLLPLFVLPCAACTCLPVPHIPHTHAYPVPCQHYSQLSISPLSPGTLTALNSLLCYCACELRLPPPPMPPIILPLHGCVFFYYHACCLSWYSMVERQVLNPMLLYPKALPSGTFAGGQGRDGRDWTGVNETRRDGLGRRTVWTGGRDETERNSTDRL